MKLKDISYITISIFLFLFPLFYLPLTAEFYEYNKMALLVFSSLLLLILLSFKVVLRRKLSISFGSYGIPLFFLVCLFLASSFIQSPNLMVSLTTPLSTSTIVFSFLLYLVLINYFVKEKKRTPQDNVKEARIDYYADKFTQTANRSSNEKSTSGKKQQIEMDKFSGVLILSSVIVAIYLFLLFAGIIPKSNFTPSGTLLSAAIFQIAIFIFTASKIAVLLLKTKKEPLYTSIIIYSMSLIIISGSIVLASIHLLSDQTPLILPIQFGWIIYAESLKNLKTLTLGIGPANFLTAFTLAKPAIINTTKFWNIVFTSSSSSLLNLATEVGTISAFIYIYIFFRAFRSLFRVDKNQVLANINPQLSYVITLVFLLVIQMILPSSMTIFTLTIVFLAFSSHKKQTLSISFSQNSKAVYLVPIFAVFISSILLYFVGRIYLAETYFKNSLDAYVNNKGREVYNNQLQAIQLNPYLDRYHRVYSQTNLALANSIASKKEITDDDKRTIPRLVQQSIDEARKAVSLQRTNIANWDNLANIYASLINFTNQSQDWAIKSYEQKILLDPVSPISRFSLGKLYLNVKQYDNAEKLFRQAINLKPDYANAHYHLSWILKEQQKYEEAQQELQITVTLIPEESEDRQRIQSELEELNKLVPEKQSTTSGSLKPVSDQTQLLEEIESSPSALENLPSPQPSIFLQAPPITPINY